MDFLEVFSDTSREGEYHLILDQTMRKPLNQLKSASGKLVRAIDIPEVADYIGENKITREFNLEKAPWWGGFWERMVKSTNLPERKLLEKQK